MDNRSFRVGSVFMIPVHASQVSRESEYQEPKPGPLLQGIGGGSSTVLVTTGWDHLVEDIGRLRERDICSHLWGDELKEPPAFRFLKHDPRVSAWACIDGVVAELAMSCNHLPILSGEWSLIGA